MAVPATGIIALLALAAFFAGLVDAIAGGGGLITLPALLAAGLPPHIALATNKGQSVFGSGASASAYALRGALDPRRARFTFPLAIAGSLAGSSLVSRIRPEVLAPIVLVLLPLATLTLLIPRKEPGVAEIGGGRRAMIKAGALALVMGAYDGFFGPGTGTFLTIGFVTFLHEPLLKATGDSKVVNFGSNLAAMSVFALQGRVLWAVSLPMALGQLAGGWTGAHLAVKGGARLIRPAVMAVVIALVAKLGWNLLHS